jgi:hypothetical protein
LKKKAMPSDILNGIIADLRVLIDQIDNNSKTFKELLLEVARGLDEDGQCETSQICTKIKNILKDKIEEGKISEKWIEECLPPHYKRKYTKSELSSLSRQAKENIAKEEEMKKTKNLIGVDTRGRSAAFVDASNITNDSHTVFKNEDEVTALRTENYELKEALKRQTSLLSAEEIQAVETRFTIPKEKYEEVKTAMETSKDSVYIVCDRSGIMQRAEPDIYYL